MTLIIILITLGVEFFTHKLAPLRAFSWLKSYALWFRNTFASIDGTLTLFLLLTPIILLLWLLLSSVNTPLWLLLAALTLWYTLGPATITPQITDYLDAIERGNNEAAMRHAEHLSGNSSSIENIEQLHQHVINGILTSTHERITATLFWFIILGPIGALLYRCNEQIKLISWENEQLNFMYEATQRLHLILGWVPTRLTAFSFALGGSMADTLACWKHYHGEWQHQFCDHNCGLLIYCGLGALQIPPDSQQNSIENIHNALSLSNRALIIWVSFIAILTLAGFA